MKETLIIGILVMTLLSGAEIVTAQESAVLRLKIVDVKGQPIASDAVRISTDGKRLDCVNNGEFIECLGSVNPASNITITSLGFEEFRISAADLNATSGIVMLTPTAGVFGVEIYSESDRSRLSPFGMSQVVVRGSELRQTAAPVLDDALRQVAGFSTFRRTSGRQANPTTQGVSLRGVGSSGASRTSVLEDGVPLNDPFGGWVQWNRVVQPLVSEVELLRGGASGLYGNSAVSGAVIIKPIDRRDGRFSGDLFGGSQQSVGGNGRIAESRGDWFFIAGFSSLRNRGYTQIENVSRGLVDSPAGVRFDSFQARVRGNLSDKIQVVFKPSVFGEVRTNGTGLQTNRTHSRSLVAGISFNGRAFDLVARVNGSNQVYDQVFSTIASNRNSETLNRIQRVPSRALGISLASTYTTSKTFLNAMNFGFDFRNVRGASDEIGFVSSAPNIRTGVGGTQKFSSLFFNNRFAKDKIVMNFSARGDFWSNTDGISVSTPVLSGITTTASFIDKNYSRFSGRAGISYQITSRVNAFASASTSFRAPTLNELYRGFRVGNVVTQPNESLLPERGREFDVGVIYSTNRLRVRSSLFRNSISDTVSNITVSSTSSLITRQRQNVGKTVSKGFEIEAEGRISDTVTFSSGYLFADSRVKEFAANPALIGRRIPQVARHQMTLQSRWSPGRFVFSKQIRISGPQFDDDLNLFRLEGFVQSDLFASYRLNEKLQLFSGIENIFNVRYSTAKTPLRSIGPPVGARIGIRWN